MVSEHLYYTGSGNLHGNDLTMEELLEEWKPRMATLVILAWIARYCSLLQGVPKNMRLGRRLGNF